MAMDGSVSHGDADTLGPDFKEYVLKEQLKWSLYNNWNFSPFRPDQWVFWSEQDHEIEPSLSLDNYADFNLNVCAIQKVRDNIRHALQKLMQSSLLFNRCLVQFWAATKTLDGRTLLTTRYEPFALAGELTGPSVGVQLCNYRIEMCRKYNCFYADAESGEEQLGLPGRVFRNQFPEFTPDVEYYTTKEYPQRDLALRCEIGGSWAVPVFEHSSRTCVGVLEIVSLWDGYWYRLDKIFLNNMNKIFQEFGLRCHDGNPACMRPVNAFEAREDGVEKGKRVKGRTHALQELKTVLRSVCRIHELPLAMTWVPCSDCNGLRRCKLGSAGVEFNLRRDSHHGQFLRASKWSHMRNGLVAGRALSSPNMVYCSDISKLSLDEYPLVPYARLCKLSGWFTVCLQCEHTEDYIYVLEFFLSARSKDNENILTTLSYILGMIGEKFTTFRLASGQSLGEEMSVEVIRFQNNQRFQFIQKIQATRDFSISSIPSSVQSSASVANTRPGFQDANMGTINAEYDLNSDSSSDSNPSSDSDHSFEQSTTSVHMVTIAAKYASSTITFKLSSPYRLVELQQKVTERLNLEAGTHHVHYKDELAELILIACDEDLDACVNTSISLGNTLIVLFLEPK